ncbi:MAG: ATP-binding protein [Pseudobdellovibrio sp.]
MINRNFVTKLKDRLLEDAPLIQVIVGPRQVGKTTGIKQVLNNAGVYFTADSPVPLFTYEIEHLWDNALRLENPLLAIDEIQKIPGWSQTIKKLWDTRTKPIKLILSGSAALSIEKDLKESLAGRYELIRAEHWNFQEAQKNFKISISEFIEFGCYPGSYAFLEDRERWGFYIRDSIIEPAIGRDILQLHPIEQPALLRQIFNICVGHPSQIVSLNKMQGQLQDRRALATLQNYLELLSFGFLVTGLQKYMQNEIRTRQTPPKLIVHDNALIRAFERPIGQSPRPDRFGFYFENAVGARLIESGWETYYWKERNHEVDFVTIGPNNEKWALEVKLTPPSLKELTGLVEFCKKHPEFKPYVACPQKVELPGINYISAEEILSFSR